jgi:hypothetical protein
MILNVSMTVRLVTELLLFLEEILLLGLFLYHRIYRRRLLLCLPELLLSLVLLVLYVDLASLLHHFTLSGDLPYGLLARTVPIFVYWLLLAVALLYFMVSAFHTGLRQRRELTPFSIQEGFDSLPIAACFFRENGLPMLRNRVMYRLVYSLTGQDIQNAEELWHGICSGPLADGAERLGRGETPLIRDPDGVIWLFSRSRIQQDRLTATQILAVDTSDLYALTEKLEGENRELAGMEKRLRELLGTLPAMKTEEEILSAKMRVHDEIGRCVLLTRKYLTGPENAAEEAALLRQWQTVTRLLERESSPGDEPSAFSQLQRAAAAMGAQVLLEGELPEDEKASYLLVTAIRECLVNAVRHAGAAHVFAKIRQSGQTAVLSVTNDGAAPAGPVAEGGGLGNLRRRVEQSGGEMRIESAPVFRLIIAVPASLSELY